MDAYFFAKLDRTFGKVHLRVNMPMADSSELNQEWHFWGEIQTNILAVKQLNHNCFGASDKLWFNVLFQDGPGMLHV